MHLLQVVHMIHSLYPYFCPRRLMHSTHHTLPIAATSNDTFDASYSFNPTMHFTIGVYLFTCATLRWCSWPSCRTLTIQERQRRVMYTTHGYTLTFPNAYISLAWCSWHGMLSQLHQPQNDAVDLLDELVFFNCSTQLCFPRAKVDDTLHARKMRKSFSFCYKNKNH